jgi:hypothetical protein
VADNITRKFRQVLELEIGRGTYPECASAYYYCYDPLDF